MTYMHRSVKKNIKCIKTTSNVEQKTVWGNSYQTLDGSIMEYTPIEGCTHIGYDYTTYFGVDDGRALNGGLRVQLQIGDSSSSYADIVTNNTNYHTQHGATNHNSSSRRHNLYQCLRIEHLIPIADWPRDSNNALKTQTLLLRFSSYGTTTCMLHGTSYDNLARDDAETLHFDPFLIMYCL